jgi:hypothetical protein
VGSFFFFRLRLAAQGRQHGEGFPSLGENLPNNFTGARPARVSWLPCCHLEEKGNLPRVHSICGDGSLAVVGNIHINLKHVEK